MRKKSLLAVLFSFVPAIIPAYGQTATALTCLDIINDPNVSIGSSISVGSTRNILAALDFVNLCNVDIRIDNLDFLVATPVPPSGEPLLVNLEFTSILGNLGSATLIATTAQGYSYGLLSGRGITVPANTTLPVTLIGDSSPNVPAAFVNSTVQVEIIKSAGIRAVIAGSTTTVGVIAMAPGTQIEILSAGTSGQNPPVGSSGSPQITLSAGSGASVTVDQITVSDDSLSHNLFPISGVIIPASQSITFNLQKSGSPITGGFSANVVMTVGSNPNDTVQMLINIPAGN